MKNKLNSALSGIKGINIYFINHSVLFIIVLCISTLLPKVFATIRTSNTLFIVCYLILAIATFFISAFGKKIPKSKFKILFYGFNSLIIFYCITHVVFFPGFWPKNVVMTAEILRWVSSILGILAFRYPALSLAPIFYIFQTKHWWLEISLLKKISEVDYLPVLETALLSVLFVVVAQIYSIVRQKKSQLIYKYFFRYAFIFILAVHFSNYFYSAIKKISLNGGIASWVLDNPTHALAINALHSNLMPISHWPHLALQTIIVFSYTVVFANFFTLVSQLSSVFFATNRKLLLGISTIYDFTHALVFLTTGIFFWKWIVVNLFIFYAAKKYPTLYTFNEILFSIVCLILAPILFNIQFLGWYDTFYLNDHYFLAHTSDDKSFRVPSNYFLGGSVSHAQSILGAIDISKALPTKTMGASSNWTIMNDSKSCAEQKDRYRSRVDVSKLKAIVQRHHRLVLDNVDTKSGTISYDLYPHHIWSNIFAFDSFKNLDKRSISSYSYHFDSVCFLFKNQKIEKKIINNSSIRLPISTSD